MNKFLFASTIAFTLSLSTPVFAADDSGSTPIIQAVEQSQKRPDNLFVMMAKTATFAKDENGNATMTLGDYRPSVVVFSDRPQREASINSLTKFIMDWQNGQGGDDFKNNPPNATVAYFYDNKMHDSEDSIVVELTNPRFAANQKTLTFDTTMINGNLDEVVAKQPIHDVAIMIDNCCWPAC